jgi:hypothetical protein
MKWRPIKSAPKDGTIIMLAECMPEYVNVFGEGSYRTYYSGNETEAPREHPTWWGLSFRLGFSGWPKNKYGRADLTACSPTHWMPTIKGPVFRKSMYDRWTAYLEEEQATESQS